MKRVSIIHMYVRRQKRKYNSRKEVYGVRKRKKKAVPLEIEK